MAEFALNMTEENISAPKLYLRYVDDSIAISKNEEEATAFLQI